MQSPKDKIQRDQSPRRRVLLALGWYSTGLHRGVASYAHKSHWVLNTQMERSGGPPRNWKGDGIICVLGSNGDIDALVASGKVPPSLELSTSPRATSPSMPRSRRSSM